jgi:hypothetical protein
MSLLDNARAIAGTHADTPYAKAIRLAAALRDAGVNPATPHQHVGENGVRCEFCYEPQWADVHDPARWKAAPSREGDKQ